METLNFPSESEQDNILKEASNAIKRAAFHMRKATDDDNMREALKCAAQMLGELRTSQLFPQKYYELYMQVFDQLTLLESYFSEEGGKGRSYAELYELVQHAGNVLPRLYLMVAAGCLYIKSGEAPAREVLRDLCDMCKGVQHPTRGLFLRAYLCQKARSYLPDTGSQYEGPGGDIHDAINFLLSNFIEMNKLWVRLQHQGSARDRDRRERERQQLQDLVGKNLTYLSQLDGLDFDMYKNEVLPRVMEQVVTCRDDIAQQYLMQALIQVFPDAFHLGTLSVLLEALPELQPGVKVHSILSSLMDRLARYAGQEASAMQALLEMDAFSRFMEVVGKVLDAHASMPSADAVEMFAALMSYCAAVHPGNTGNVNMVLAAAHNALRKRPTPVSGDAKAERALVALLTVPLQRYGVATALGLSEFPPLTSLLRHSTHKELAVRICQGVLDQAVPISDPTRVAMLFRFIAPLVADPSDAQGPAADLDDEDLEEEQVLVARLLHHLTAPHPDTHFEILTTVHQQLLRGGPRRLRTTLPALCFQGLALHRRLARHLYTGEPLQPTNAAASTAAATSKPAAAAGTDGAKKEAAGASKTVSEDGTGKATADGDASSASDSKAEDGTASPTPEAPAATTSSTNPDASADVSSATTAPVKLTCEALLQFLLAAIAPLLDSTGSAAAPMTGLRLTVALGVAASEEAGLELLAYTLFEEALRLYEDALSDQRQRVVALSDLAGALMSCRIFGKENRTSLTEAVTAASMKLLHRYDQVRALCLCSHLFWQDSSAAPVPAHLPAGRQQTPVRDASQVLVVLKRALKVAGQAKAQWQAVNGARPTGYAAAYVLVAEQYVWYCSKGVKGFDAKAVQEVLDAAAAEIGEAPAGNEPAAKHLQALVDSLKGKDALAAIKAPTAHLAAIPATPGAAGASL